MNFKALTIGVLAATAVVPAAASAQAFGYSRHGDGYAYSRAAPYSYGSSYRSDELGERIDRTREWVRRGSEDGWLRDWQARRAWQELRRVREIADNGYDRREAWQRLNRLTEFLRDARGGRY